MKSLWTWTALLGAGSKTRPPTSLPEYLKNNQLSPKDLEAIESGKRVAKLIKVDEDAQTRILGCGEHLRPFTRNRLAASATW
jgi:hypothetical protein